MQCASGQRSVRENRLHHRRRRRQQLGGGHDAIHQPDAKRFLRVDHFAGEQQLQRAALADEARQPLRAAVAWHESELHLGLTELRGLRRDANVARHRELAAAAEREAIHGGDHRLGRRLEATKHVLAALRERLRRDRAVLLELGDVGAGDEGAAGAGEDDAANARVAAQRVDGMFRARRSRDR